MIDCRLPTLKSFVFALSVLFIQKGVSQNPMVQTAYTADPAPMVYIGNLYLYTGHAQDASTWFVMNNWKQYTTEDRVAWTGHKLIVHQNSTPRVKKGAE